MASNIVVGAPLPSETPTPLRYNLPLSFDDQANDFSEVVCTIGNTNFILLFNYNIILESLFLSCYNIDKTVYYFAGFQCVFNSYINEIDNDFPYLFYFLDQSNGQNYANNSDKITYASLSNGVKLYAELR